MAWQGMRKCPDCGGHFCNCIESRSRADERESRARRMENFVQRQHELQAAEDRRIEELKEFISSTTSRDKLLELAAKDPNGDVRLAALLRLEDLPRHG